MQNEESTDRTMQFCPNCKQIVATTANFYSIPREDGEYDVEFDCITCNECDNVITND